VGFIIYNQIKAGDYTGDGIVDIHDLVTLSNILAGNIQASQELLTQAEPFKDGVTDVRDLITLANFLAGNIPSLPVIPSP